MRALHSPPWRLDIARYRRRPPQIRVRVKPVIPQFRPDSLSLADYLSRHWIDSPRQPDDLFLFERPSSHDTFEASYPVESAEEPYCYEVSNSLKLKLLWVG